MCVCVCVMCDPQFPHPHKGNSNPFLPSSLDVKRLERERALRSLGIVSDWALEPDTHFPGEKRQLQPLLGMGQCQGISGKGKSQGI